jgi:hypothetical protein
MNDEKSILTKRFQTTMIGALYEFEKSFGYLWGCDKDPDIDLTEREEKFLDMWEETRNRILNNGNNQLRKAVSELDNVSKNPRYKYNFYNRKG